MTQVEFSILSMALKTYYPRESVMPNRNAVELWYRQLADIPYSIAEAALNRWVATKKWPPSIAELREEAARVTQKKAPDWSDAWEKVTRAIKSYGAWDQGSAMQSLDGLTREAVARMGWHNLCMSEKPAVERANFRMIYERLAERQHEENLLPAELKAAISKQQIGALPGFPEREVGKIAAETKKP